MPRYLPQDLFDSMAIMRAMADLRAHPTLDEMFARTIGNYRTAYKDEDSELLMIDLSRASSEVTKIATDLYDAFFDSRRPDRDAVYFAILKELATMRIDEGRKKQSLFQKNLWGNALQLRKAARSRTRQ